MTIVWNAQRVGEGLVEIEAARPIVLKNVKRLLDEYHGVDRSLRFYDIILGDWIERYLHLVYVAAQDYSLRVSESQTKERITDAITIEPPSDTAEFFAAFRTLPGLMMSVIQALSVWGVNSVSVSDNEVVVENSVKTGSRDKLVAFFLRMISFASKPRVLFVKPFSGRTPNTWFFAMANWRKWAIHDDLDFGFLVRARVDSQWRRRNITSLPVGAKLSDLANSALSLFLPVCAVEGLAEIVVQVNQARPKRFEVVFSAQALWTHFAFKLLVAQWCDQGTKLHYHQHGGWYGLDEIHVGEQYESRVADTYYTWGWNRGNNTQPLPPVTAKMPNEEKLFDSLICFDQPQQIYRLQFFPLPGNLQTMYEQTVDFVRDRSSETELRIRLFPGENGNHQKKAIIAADEHAIFDSTQDIFSQYSRSRIVFHNYLGTSWLETLGNNIPTICFYDADAYRFRSDAKILLDDLEKVGILHLSGAGAAKKANSIGGDIDSWWSSDEVQTARINFVKQFANFSLDWKQIWLDNFSQTLKPLHNS